MKNPLHKRLGRELLGDWKKYLVIFLFLTLVIGFISGMFVANNSMLLAANDGETRYRLEYGNFELKKKASKELLAAIETGEVGDVKKYYEDKAAKEVEAYGEAAMRAAREAVDEEYAKSDEAKELEDVIKVPVTVYPIFYKQTSVEESKGTEETSQAQSEIRVFKRQENIDLACVMEGRLPENEREIAIDRMHADNAGLVPGDTVTIRGEAFEIVGLIAYVNYSTLFEKNSDTMFDALSFDVGMVTDEGYDRIRAGEHYVYAWLYNEAPADQYEEKVLSDNLVKILASQALVEDNELTEYIPRYANQAIQFATSDMGSDKTMAEALLYILIVVLAFIFAVTTNTTIEKEAQVIGVLRASGYRIGELLRHYLTMPILVTLAAAGVGNVLGYALFKYIVVNMYYNSYSLPTYQTVFTAEALYKTTLVPIALMLIINLIVIRKRLSLSPLKFLRGDLSTSKRKKAMRLPRAPFMHRFRMRVALQNLPNYVILLLGIYFVLVLFTFAVALPQTLDHYMDHITDTLLAQYQVVLKETTDDGNEIKTAADGAEHFSLTTLKMDDVHGEEIMVYGLEPDSRYVTLPDALEKKEVAISSAYADKYEVGVGDTIKLKEKFSDQSYAFTVRDILGYNGALTVFMPNDAFNAVFDRETDAWNGFLSDTEITDVPEKYIASVITVDDVTKVARQLQHSMGGYMDYFTVVCIILALILIYLLTKIIIEKNENAISMCKILGYDNREIAGLYLVTTTICIVICELIAVWGAFATIRQVWIMILREQIDGWLPLYMNTQGFVRMLLSVFGAYLIVTLFDFRRIKRIPMDQALKHVE